MSDNTNLLLLQLKLQKKEDDYFLVTLYTAVHHHIVENSKMVKSDLFFDHLFDRFPSFSFIFDGFMTVFLHLWRFFAVLRQKAIGNRRDNTGVVSSGLFIT